MNRQQRRQSERLNDSAIRDLRKKTKESVVKEINDRRVEAMMFCFALALNSELGFDQPEQVLPIISKSDEFMAAWIAGTETIETLRTKVRDATGVDIKC